MVQEVHSEERTDGRSYRDAKGEQRQQSVVREEPIHVGGGGVLGLMSERTWNDAVDADVVFSGGREQHTQTCYAFFFCSWSKIKRGDGKK